MSADNQYYDNLETRQPAAREVDLLARLPQQIKHAIESAEYYRDAYQTITADSITSREALATLPIIRKSELLTQQSKFLPFGGYNATSVGNLKSIFASPGPIYEPEGKSADYWRMARALYAAGVRQGDLVYNTFSYHFSPAGSMLESGAQAIGCPVFPAGTGQTELQARTIADLKPNVYVGTPSFLNILLDKATELDCSLSSFEKALVSGEALPPPVREQIESQGIAILQCYATADLGLIAYESNSKDGLIIDEQVIVEIVRPGTGDPVAEGEVGEVVVTTFNQDYPLIRFATGDLSATIPGISDCGRTNTRLKGWMGRADQTAKVKGMFVHPQQVNEVVKRYPEITRARLVVEQNDRFLDTMTLLCEFDGEPADGFQASVESTMREVCKLRGVVEWVVVGGLANDGVVIEDRRPV